VGALGDRIAEEVQALGYEVAGPRGLGSGIVSFRRPNVDSNELVNRLRQRGILTAARSGWVRASPHFYISPDEIVRFVKELR